MTQITQDMIDSASNQAKDGFYAAMHDWILKPYSTKEWQNGDQIFDDGGNPVLDDDDNPTYERVLVDVVKHRITGYSAKQVQAPTYVNFDIENVLVTINGYPAETINDVYTKGVKGNSLTVTCDIVDKNADEQGGSIVNISSSELRLPFEKVTSESVVIDEDKLDATISNGQLVAVGVFERGGTWVITEERINKSLAEINVNWRISLPTSIKFHVASKKQ